MEIARTTGVAGGATAAAAPQKDTSKTGSSSKTLGYDAFLQLLIAQLQHQDPLEPMKSSDYVAQLASFSEVEKSIELNDRVASLLTATRLQQAEAAIGRNVTSADGTVSGVITAAKVVGNDVVATLADGREVRLEAGTVLSGGKS